MTPRSGLTSEKSRPHATATWSSLATRSLVGSRCTQPAAGAAPHRDPGVAGVGAAQRDLVLGARRADVARDVAGGEAVGAQRGDLDMGEILADAGLAGEDLGQRRADVGGAGMVLEIRLDARGELACRRQDGPAGRERLGAVGAQRLDGGHQRRIRERTRSPRRRRESRCRSARSRSCSHGECRPAGGGSGKRTSIAARTSMSKRLCGLSIDRCRCCCRNDRCAAPPVPGRDWCSMPIALTLWPGKARARRCAI